MWRCASILVSILCGGVVLGRRPEKMKWITIQLISSIVVGSIVTALTARAASTEFPDFELGTTTHETWARSQDASQFPKGDDTASEREAVSSARPTRTTLMANWDTIYDANGYLLDVSTDDSFSHYVDGYHDLDVGDSIGRLVAGLKPGTKYYYRVRAYGDAGLASYSEVRTGSTTPTTGLIIHPTFDSTITGNPNAAAIEAMINRAISIYESIFSDSITIQIRFRYATTAPDGTALPQGLLSQSLTGIYTAPWNTYISALRTDAETSNDDLANAGLPHNPLSTTIKPASANGRAVGLNTPPAMFANGNVGQGGPYDGIVTLNSALPFQFSRPTSANRFDAQRMTEHEIDEVIGLGSHLGHTGTGIRPQDLFSWAVPGTRNITSSGTRYFSINSYGLYNIVNFNQHANGDFGDWSSASCPQTHPYVQNAFSCPGQSYDIGAISPEGTNLDVVGYDLIGAPARAQTDFNGDGYPDLLLYAPAAQRTFMWYLRNHVLAGALPGPILAAPWQVIGAADFNRDTHADYVLLNSDTRSTVIWHMREGVHIGGGTGPTLPGGAWSVVALTDFNVDAYPDYLLYNADTHRTVVWYMRDNVHLTSNSGPTLPSGWNIVGAADFNGDGEPDFVLFKPSTGQSVIWYLSGLTHTNSRPGPTIPAGYDLAGVADFNRDAKPDYLLWDSTHSRTAIWYLNDNVRIATATGPNLNFWTIVAP
jgi:hypothetical protein